MDKLEMFLSLYIMSFSILSSWLKQKKTCVLEIQLSKDRFNLPHSVSQQNKNCLF